MGVKVYIYIYIYIYQDNLLEMKVKIDVVVKLTESLETTNYCLFFIIFLISIYCGKRIYK